MIWVFVVIYFTRAYSAAGVITGDDKHVLLLYNTGILSAVVTAEDNRAFVLQNVTGV